MILWVPKSYQFIDMVMFEDRFFGFLLKKDPTAACAMLAEESVVLMSPDSFVTALHSAAQRGYAPLALSLILLMSADSINAPDRLGRTALHVASEFRRIAVVEILLEKMSPAAINAAAGSPCRRTALHNAAANGDVAMIEMLLPVMTKETIDATDGAGWTALMHAAGDGRDRIVELLLPKMSQPAIDTHDKSRVTALHLAGGEGHMKIVKMLLGAMSHDEIRIRNIFGKHISDYPGMGNLTYVNHLGETRFTS
jgi:ankyrin repeat protein